MKKMILIFTLTGLFLGGCLLSKSKGGGALPLNFQKKMTITAINEQEGYFVISRVNSRCQDSVLESTTRIDTNYYEISKGSLYIWGRGKDCYAEKYEGSSSSIKGAWVLTDFETYQANKPGPMADAKTCEERYEEQNKPEYKLPYVKSVKGTLVISSSEYSFDVSYDNCLARGEYRSFTDGASYAFNASDTNITIKEGDCNGFEVKIGQKTAQVKFVDARVSEGLEGYDYTMTFTYGDKSCEHIVKEGKKATSDAECVAEKAQWELEDKSRDDFNKCVIETGFYTSRSLPKSSAIRSEVKRKSRNSFSFFE